MSHLATIPMVAVLAVAVLLPACDLGEYPGLGEKRDETRVFGSGASTWVAFETTKVTLLVLGDKTGAEPASFALIELGAAEGDESLTGTYDLDPVAGTLTLSATLEYESNSGTSQSGNARTPVARTLAFAFRSNDDQVLLSGDVSMPPLRDFGKVVSGLDEASPEGARCAVELLNLTTGSAELRMPGFGGRGMLEYSRAAVFRGQLAGTVRVSLDDLLSPLTQFAYDGYSDFTGYTVSGTKATKTDTGGNGALYGTLHFAIATAPLPSDHDASVERTSSDSGTSGSISGEVVYGSDDASGGIRLEDGDQRGGTYAVTIDGGESFNVPYDAPTALHLAACFPD